MDDVGAKDRVGQNPVGGGAGEIINCIPAAKQEPHISRLHLKVT